MASKYWLKLWHVMLDDPKVARLSDSAYRLFIECLLLAGELDSNGLLPALEDIAWRLRKSETALTSELSHLAISGMVEIVLHEGEERWFVSNFKKRQEPNANARDQARWRKRQKERKEAKERKKDTDTDTDTYGKVTNKLTNKLTSKDSSSSGGSAVFSAFESNIMQITPAIEEGITQAVNKYGADKVIAAIAIATEANVKTWRYVKGVLKKKQMNTESESSGITVTEQGGVYV